MSGAPGKPLSAGALERERHGAALLAVRRGGLHVELGPRERDFLASLTDWPLRAAEWRAGRHAAKEVLRQAFGLEPSRVEILPADSGAPVLHVDGARAQSIFLSLSHTDTWAVAVAAPFPIGVDVADDEDGARLPRIAGRVFSVGEADACGAQQSTPHQAAVWALKEAGLKLHLGGVFSPGARSIKVLSLEPARVEGLEVALYRLDGAAVAAAWDAR